MLVTCNLEFVSCSEETSFSACLEREFSAPVHCLNDVSFLPQRTRAGQSPGLLETSGRIYPLNQLFGSQNVVLLRLARKPLAKQ